MCKSCFCRVIFLFHLLHRFNCSKSRDEGYTMTQTFNPLPFEDIISAHSKCFLCVCVFVNAFVFAHVKLFSMHWHVSISNGKYTLLLYFAALVDFFSCCSRLRAKSLVGSFFFCAYSMHIRLANMRYTILSFICLSTTMNSTEER